LPRLRSLILVAGLFLLPVALLACGGDGGGADGRPAVVATTAVIGALTQEVTGDLVDVTVLASAGIDPHDYELTANDQKAVDRALLIFRNGLGFDEYLDQVLGSSANRGKVVVVTEGIDLLNAEVGDEEDGGDGQEDGADPHVWQDPIRVKTMVANIAEALAEKDPSNAYTYRQNAEAYQAVLDDTDQEIRQIIESIPPANRKIVTIHAGFGYFIDRYQLEFIGSVIPATTTAAEPSARHLAALQDTIRAEGVKAIFGESTADSRIARQIASDTGIRLVDNLYGDSLGDPGTPEGTVHGMLLANARKIAEALQ